MERRSYQKKVRQKKGATKVVVNKMGHIVGMLDVHWWILCVGMIVEAGKCNEH
jgi:hypothetical protein